MRTFKLELGFDMKIVVPEKFTKDMREVAQAEDASEFLKHAQELFPLPTQDEEFTLHIVKHGIRTHTRSALADLCAGSGLGCTLSPARAKVIDVPVRCTPN